MKPRFFPYMIRKAIKDDDTQGINKGWWVQHESYAKTNSEISELLLANEWVAGQIATIMRLPSPPFALFHARRHPRRMFGSLRYDSKDTSPADCRPVECAVKNPFISTAIIVFDILIANEDRHRENIKVNDPRNPTEVWAIDHERALFGTKRSQASRRLGERKDKLALGNHCLAPHLETSAHFKHWIDVASHIGVDFLNSICKDTIALGATTKASSKLFEFLSLRRTQIADLVNGNKAFFSSVQHWLPLK